MKKKTIFLILLAVPLLFAACSDDNEMTNIPVDGNGIITFVLPGANSGSVTYADPVASAEENKLDALNIYVFADGNKKLEKVFRTSDIQFGGSGAARTATINMTGREGKKIFYFVGNGNDVSEELKDINVGVTDVADFIETITDRNVKMPVTPLLMSGTTTIDDVQNPNPDQKKVLLKRRVARFDVHNDSVVTNFRIDKILVAKSNQRAYVFNDATKSKNKQIETGNFASVDFSKFTNANKGETPSVFYIYPTTLGKTKTQISLEGVFNKETRIYNLNLDKDVEIDPNKRYILKAKPVPINMVEFSLEIEDWALGSTHITEPETELIKFSDYEIVGGTNLDRDGDVFKLERITTAAKINFTATSYGSQGVKVDFNFRYGDPDKWKDLKINNPPPVLTYAAYYVQNFEIDVPAPSGKTPFEVVITLTNVANPDQKKKIVFYAFRYPGTNLYPVFFNNVYWAPVNAGATTLNGFLDYGDMGYTYQWGRPIYKGIYGVSDDLQVGPVTNTAAGDAIPNKFITSVFAPNDWLQSVNNALWLGNSNTTNVAPCPADWRVPTEAELEYIRTAFTSSTPENPKVEWAAPYLKVKGAHIAKNPNEILYLPAAGYRHYNGDWIGQGVNGAYWSGNNAATTKWMTFTSTQMDALTVTQRANGASVRCVKQNNNFP